MPQALTITQTPGKPGTVYYPLSITAVPTPSLDRPTQLLLRILTASLNHRDLFIRQHLYPGTSFSPVPLLADGCGLVVAAGAAPSAQSWLGKRVVINPGTGWRDDVHGPEEEEEKEEEGSHGSGRGARYRILGGTEENPNGTGQEYMAIEAGEVEEAPTHLADAEAAALPLTGLTAWRALMVKVGPAKLGTGTRLLVTGIGGGVALMALTFAVAMGTEVWVTSGSEDKIQRAVQLGARGGLSYREDGWEKKLLGLVRDGGNAATTRTPLFDAIVDGAGGDVVEKGAKILKPGGVIVSYGMTLGPKMPFLMQAVLKNIELKGSTMGSRREFQEMIEFVRQKEIKPVISRTVQGLDNIEAIDDLFEDMKKGNQFGKLVIEIARDDGTTTTTTTSGSKL
ncbi:hypothetical protein GJ744_003211 [Endocarpon pusillum]|uniref:Enoyl reductase (ER) domain-containing protein n=1 Tax=Endocarpon pusillum TaxID=364733 RepID=A0A8H7E8C1_9EURO|nr:hypothetical protein GJ744_003211 [Endocarpon pusillum]